MHRTKLVGKTPLQSQSKGESKEAELPLAFFNAGIECGLTDDGRTAGLEPTWHEERLDAAISAGIQRRETAETMTGT